MLRLGFRGSKLAYAIGWLLALAGPVVLPACSLFEGQPQVGASRNGSAARLVVAKVLSADWVQTTKADFITGATENVEITGRQDGEITLTRSAGKYAGAGTYTSTIKESSFPFNAVGVQWRADIPEKTEVIGETRTSADGVSFSDWKGLITGADAEDRGGKGEAIAELVLTPSHRWVQYRFIIRTMDPSVSPSIEEVVVTFIDSTRGPTLSQAKAATVESKAAGQPAIIPRSAWGADESLRVKDGKEIWPAQRRPVEKLIIHHTVTQNDDPNPPATIRAIYEYHAAKLGWGDIGYNYLVDAEGNIYEGRYGGDDVAAGHAKQYNFGSIGIGVLGNYNKASLSSGAREALINLISGAVVRHGIDPYGKSYLADKEFPNVSGHRDALPTTCPGNLLENELPNIRSKAASRIPLYGLKWESHDTPAALQPRQTASVKISVSNRGRKVWTPRGESTFTLGYHWYRPDGSQVKQTHADDKRSNLSRDVAFGQSIAVDALLTAPEEPGTYTVKWDVVQEGVTWLADQGASPLETTIIVGEKEPTPPSGSRPSPGSPQTTWYFAEGATTRGYRTYFQIMNPNADSASVALTLMTEAGTTRRFDFVVKPTSRLTVNAGDLLPNSNLATKIESDRRIYAERTVLFGHDGHTSFGVAQPASTWYFAEGSTALGFGTWLLLMNPNDSETKVAVTFFRENGSTTTKDFRLKPTSRLNVFVNKEVSGMNVGMKVDGDKPIVAERSMYVDGGKGGHGSIGVTELSRTWLFAEGYTGSGVNTWLLLLNPNRTSADVTVTLYRDGGDPVVKTLSVSPNSRRNVLVNQAVPNAAVSAKVEASVPIVAERSMFFANGKGTHNTVGATKSARTWYLPEGYTGAGVGEWLLIFNPEPAEAQVNLTFMRSDGTISGATIVVGPRSRYTLYLNSVLPEAEVSTKVEASRPVVVERSIYFGNGEGGTVSLGIPGD